MTATIDQQQMERRYGLPALFEELESQGVSQQAVLVDSGVVGTDAELNYHERLAPANCGRRYRV